MRKYETFKKQRWSMCARFVIHYITTYFTNSDDVSYYWKERAMF